MPIPSEVKEVIRLAAIQDTEETKLQDLRDRKISLMAQLEDVLEQINLQQTIVQAARTALKQAAALI